METMKSNGTKLGTKKIIMILALALCLILAGCGGNSGSQNETPAQTTEKDINSENMYAIFLTPCSAVL